MKFIKESVYRAEHEGFIVVVYCRTVSRLWEWYIVSPTSNKRVHSSDYGFGTAEEACEAVKRFCAVNSAHEGEDFLR